MENKIIFNVKQVSKYLNVSESCIRKAIRENKIPHFRIMSKILFDKSKIDDFISDNNFITNNNTLLKYIK